MHGLSKPPDGNFQCSIKAQKSAVSIFQANRKPVQRFKNGAGYPLAKTKKSIKEVPAAQRLIASKIGTEPVTALLGPGT